MSIANLIANELVKPVASDFVVSKVIDLDNLVSIDLAKRQIECPSAPVKDENPTAVEFCEVSTIFFLGAQICVKSGQRLVNEPNDAYSRLSPGLAQSSAASSIQLYRNGQYRAAFEKATAVAVAEVRATALRLDEAKGKLLHAARGKAGLLAVYQDAKEIRDVLRAMSPEARDHAISHAAKIGDRAVIAALQAHPPLVGATHRPIEAIIDEFVASRAPEEMAKIADLDTASEHLELAYGQFSKSVEGMRDLQAEEVGDKGNKAAREAEAKLGLALMPINVT